MYDCVIVGAGLAGLLVGKKLAAQNLKIAVVESRDRVGGRIFSQTTPEGAIIEHGGQWISEGHNRMLDLVKEYQLTLLRPASGDMVIRTNQINQRVPVNSDAKNFLNPFEVADFGKGISSLRRLVQRHQNDPVWAKANTELFAKPFPDWLTANMRIENAKKFLTKKLQEMNVDVETVNLGQVLQRIKTDKTLDSLVSVHPGIPQWRTSEGIYQICLNMAKELGSELHLSTPVEKVEQKSEQIVVTAKTGAKFACRKLVLALPPQMVKTLEFSPRLPDWRFDWQKRIKVGNVTKAHIIYRQPWWKKQGFSGQIVSDEAPVRVTFDTSPEDDSLGVIMGFYSDQEALKMADRSITLRQRGFVEALAKIFGTKARQDIGYYEMDWTNETYTGGTHGGHFVPSLWTEVGYRLSDPEGKIYFAGAEYSAESNGFMEGALISGEQVVKEILS